MELRLSYLRYPFKIKGAFTIFRKDKKIIYILYSHAKLNNYSSVITII